MIRVRKSAVIPASLLIVNCNNYDGQDVQEALVADQHEKCYLCEQRTTKSFQIEHLKSKAIGYFPLLKYTWSNLFLSCPYCNGRKPNNFDLLDPAVNNIEDVIAHRLDLAARSAVIISLKEGIQENYTVRLLDKLLNGKDKLRDIKGAILFKYIEREIVFFLQLLNDYKNSNSPENKQRVIDSLLITKEFLAFKYWIVKDNANLYADFKDHMIWNKN
jgi:hypothetical protein